MTGRAATEWFDVLGLDDMAGVRVDVADTLTGPSSAAMFSPCGTYRYALARVWDPSRPPAVFAMLNPSTADAVDDDPTIRRCVDFAVRWGRGGLLVVNVFALRATDPKRLATHPDPVGPDNDAVIGRLLAGGRVQDLVAAWGVNRWVRVSGRADRLLGLLEVAGVAVSCLGRTKDGFPRHPLYVKATTELEPFVEA